MDIAGREIPIGIRLALEQRFEGNGCCQISASDMATDIGTWLNNPFDIDHHKPTEVLRKVIEYLSLLEEYSGHQGRWAEVMPTAVLAAIQLLKNQSYIAVRMRQDPRIIGG